MGSRKGGGKKEDRAEDCCFFCKDGGLLRVCDFSKCLKAYHPACVKRNDDLLTMNDRWYCGWHYCVTCGKSAKFHCFTCPDSFCGCCIRNSKFVIVRGKKGLCPRCMKLAVLIEECKKADANGYKVDFNDQDTYEFMFKEYWETLKETESLSKQDLFSEDGLLRSSHNYSYGYDSEEYSEEDESDYEILIDDEEQSESSQKRKIRGKLPCSSTEKPRKRPKMEFIGWASILLIEFCESIGQETVDELSEQDVASIITKYCQENKLFHPEKKKQIVCDSRLYKLFRKKTVNKNSLLKLLSCHFTENSEQLEQMIDDLDNHHENPPRVSGRAFKWRQEKEVLGSKEGCFASMASENIKLVYLRRSLMEQLAKESKNFEDKVMGSFVRVKSDPHDYLQKNSHQLVQVTGIKKSAGIDQVYPEIVFQVSNTVNDVPISKISDDDFSQEECEDLRQRVKDGRLKRPTAVEFEKTARNLHEDITKHVSSTARNGAEDTFYGGNSYRLQLLQTQAEQEQLLQELPVVMAEEEEPEAEDNKRKSSQEFLEKEILIASSNHLKSYEVSCPFAGAKEFTDEAEKNQLESHQLSRDANEDSRFARKIDEEEEKVSGAYANQFCKNSSLTRKLDRKDGRVLAVDANQNCKNIGYAGELDDKDGGVSHAIQNCKNSNYEGELDEKDESVLDANQDCRNSNRGRAGELDGKGKSILDASQYCKKSSFTEKLYKEDEYDSAVAANENCNKPYKKDSKNSGFAGKVDKKDENGLMSMGNTEENREEMLWYCLTPHGVTKGPYSMSLLREWYETSPYRLNFRVFRVGEEPQNAVLLGDATR